MITRRTRWTVSAISLLVASGVALAAIPPLVVTTAPTGTAQVGVPYSSSVGITGGISPYVFDLDTGTLPPGLTLSIGGAITGTPTTPGNYQFTVFVADSHEFTDASNSGAPTTDAARRRVRMHSGNPGATTTSPTFSILVSGAPSATPVPPSVWMAMTGLAGAGLFRLRQKRRG